MWGQALKGLVGLGHAEAVGLRGRAWDSVGSVPLGLIDSKKSTWAKTYARVHVTYDRRTRGGGGFSWFHYLVGWLVWVID
jgi:hypothetical protein